MIRKIPAFFAILLVLIASVSAQSVSEMQTSLPRRGQVVNGFEVTKVSDFDIVLGFIYRIQDPFKILLVVLAYFWHHLR